jgi:hypothetical protein
MDYYQPGVRGIRASTRQRQFRSQLNAILVQTGRDVKSHFPKTCFSSVQSGQERDGGVTHFTFPHLHRRPCGTIFWRRKTFRCGFNGEKPDEVLCSLSPYLATTSLFQTCYNLFCVFFTHASKLVCPMFKPARSPFRITRSTRQWPERSNPSSGFIASNLGAHRLADVRFGKRQHILGTGFGVCPSHRETVGRESNQLNAVLDNILWENTSSGNLVFLGKT